MAYITATIKVEEEIWNKIPNGEKSNFIRQCARDYINAKESDIENINVELLILQIKTLESQIAKLSAELNSKVKIMEKIKEEQELKRQKYLENERQKIEESKKCLKCRNIIEEEHKKHKFSKGLVCNGCFMSATKEDLQNWR